MQNEIKWKTEKRCVKDLIPYSKNPRRLTEKQKEDLKKSIEKFNLAEIPVINTDNTIIAGHQRIKILHLLDRKDDNIDVRIPDRPLTAKEVEEYNLRSNLNTGEWDFGLLADFDSDFLKDLGFDDSELEMINNLKIDVLDADKQEEKQKITRIDLEPEEEILFIKDKIRDADKIVFSFSGGKDSCLSVAKTLPLLKDKEVEAVFVDTGAEFPDLPLFIKDFCEAYNISFKVLRSKHDIVSYYDKKKEFPNVLYRDCIGIFINKTIDDYVFNLPDEKILLVRGGRSNQKKGTSKSDIYNEFERSKTKVIKILNPIFNMTQEKFDEEIKKISLWEGYSQGFNRTACWLCPFQHEEQWEALKKRYRCLWELMRKLSQRWEFKEIKGDNNLKRFRKYWDNQHDEDIILR